MSAHFPSRTLISGLLVAAGFFAVAQTSVAATARLKWTPPYGEPFDNLEWFGEAEVTDNNCPATGSILGANVDLNFGGGACANQFSFVKASLGFADVSAPGTTLWSIDFGTPTTPTFGKVAAVERTSTNPDDWTKVYSGAFRAVQADIPQSLYFGPAGNWAVGTQAWFSLVFVGSFAQLIWFEKDPGVPIFNESGIPFYDSSLQYAGCYLLGDGDNSLKKFGFFGKEVNRCGISDANNAAGAELQISVVPEPQAYLMALVSLGVLGVAGSVSRRRKAKR
jgi:hypothetical protein